MIPLKTHSQDYSLFTCVHQHINYTGYVHVVYEISIEIHLSSWYFPINIWKFRLIYWVTSNHLQYVGAIIYNVMPHAHRSYKLSTISFETFGVSKLLSGNPPHTEANSFKSCKAENANIQRKRIAHALHTKDVSKLLCSTHTERNISLVAKRRKQVAL